LGWAFILSFFFEILFRILAISRLAFAIIIMAMNVSCHFSTQT
jgi:hypothetical protein